MNLARFVRDRWAKPGFGVVVVRGARRSHPISHEAGPTRRGPTGRGRTGSTGRTPQHRCATPRPSSATISTHGWPCPAPARRTGLQPAGLRAIRAAPAARPRRRATRGIVRAGRHRPGPLRAWWLGCPRGDRQPAQGGQPRVQRPGPAPGRSCPAPAGPPPPGRGDPVARRLRPARVQPQGVDHGPVRQPVRHLRSRGDPGRGDLGRGVDGRGRPACRPAPDPQALPLSGLPRPAGRRREPPGSRGRRRHRACAGPGRRGGPLRAPRPVPHARRR